MGDDLPSIGKLLPYPKVRWFKLTWFTEFISKHNFIT